MQADQNHVEGDDQIGAHDAPTTRLLTIRARGRLSIRPSFDLAKSSARKSSLALDKQIEDMLDILSHQCQCQFNT